MAKLDNKKLLACCANGAGSSLMMEKAIEKVMKNTISSRQSCATARYPRERQLPRIMM